MVFGKIDYINLLPFSLFIKRTPYAEPLKKSVKLGVPSKINQMFKKRKVDFAFISSIKSTKSQSLDIGIVARYDVMSVILYIGDSEYDVESNTSNVLAKILSLNGEVLIGDKALVSNFYREGSLDLAKCWNEKFKLPFVFARLCCNSNFNYIKKLISIYKPNYIPHYVLQKHSKRLNIPVWYLKLYLSKIDYTIDIKAKKGLKLFISKAKRV